MRFAIPVLMLAIGLLAGWLLSPREAWKSSASETAEARGDTPARSSSASKVQGTGPARVTPRLVAAFESGRTDYPSIRSLVLALDNISSANVSEFTTFFKKQPFRIEQSLLWRMYISAWGEVDPRAAVAFIDERFEDGGTRRLFYLAVLDTWKNHSQMEALEFAMQSFLPADSGSGADLARDYLRELAKTSLSEALGLAANLTDGEVVFELTARRVAQLRREDPEAAARALDSLEGELHTHAVSGFVADWAKEDPAAAAEWLSANYDPMMGLFTLEQVAREYVQSDPAGTLAWINGLPIPEQRSELLGAAVQAWAEKDSAAAAAWLAQLESSPAHDAAVIAFGNQLATEQPQRVIEEWVPRISDSVQGNQLLAEVSLTWQRDNPAAFSQWLEETTSLPAETKQRLRAREVPGDQPQPAVTPGGGSGDNLNEGR